MFGYNPLLIGISFLWLVGALIDYSEYCYVWQLKEYRLDRFADFVKTRKGQRIFLGYRYVWRAILVLTLFTFFSTISDNLIFIVFLIFVLDFAYNSRRFLRKTLVRPKATNKALLIILASFLVETIVLAFFHQLNLALILLVFRFATLSVVVYLINLLTSLIKIILIKRAASKISKYKDLIVIGVTGSYGKTTVKEFLSHILSRKFQVVKTPKHINTDIGVANFILKNSFEDKEIFVVEMGAYNVGEIKKICDIVHPKIGILTAVSEQHLSLFGSIDNIVKAKSELLQSIPKDGAIVTNADNPHCAKAIKEIKCKNIFTFGIDDQAKPDCLIKDIQVSLDGIECKGQHNDQEIILKAPVIGSHQAFNIAPCVITALHLGMNKGDVLEQCSNLPLNPASSMSIHKYGKATILDDSYNSNPAGFKAALEIVSKYPSSKKRIVVTRGMLELGNRAEQLHEEVAEEVAFCADALVVISPDYIDPIKKGTKGISNKYPLEIVELYNYSSLLKHIKDYKNESVVILLENRIPRNLYDELVPKEKQKY